MMPRFAKKSLTIPLKMWKNVPSPPVNRFSPLLYHWKFGDISPVDPKGGAKMEKWRCQVCDYVYDPAQGDPDNGVPPNTSFESLPEGWQCPVCGVGKDEFEKVA
jgi:rubredoxin